MPLEAILQALDAEAARELAAIKQAGQAEIAQIEADADRQASLARQKQIDAICAPLKAEQARLINQAKLKALQIVLGTREELISAAMEATARNLADFTESAAYPELLKQLACEAAAPLGADQPLRFRVRTEDVPLMEQLAQQLNLDATVIADLREEDTVWDSGLGGVIASTADRRVSVVNTLEARLQRAATVHRAKLAGWLLATSGED
jgi:vacuolar-type H+-ATPase subunit E/Vma4